MEVDAQGYGREPTAMVRGVLSCLFVCLFLAPIAYINVVAVKKLVVEVWVIAVVRLRSLDSKSPPSSIQ